MTDAPNGSEVPARIAALTERQHQVLNLLVEGHQNKMIAFQLGITTRTVEFHRGRVMKKMQAKTCGDLIRIVLANGANLEVPLKPQQIREALDQMDSALATIRNILAGGTTPVRVTPLRTVP